MLQEALGGAELCLEAVSEGPGLGLGPGLGVGGLGVGLGVGVGLGAGALPGGSKREAMVRVRARVMG